MPAVVRRWFVIVAINLSAFLVADLAIGDGMTSWSGPVTLVLLVPLGLLAYGLHALFYGRDGGPANPSGAPLAEEIPIPRRGRQLLANSPAARILSTAVAAALAASTVGLLAAGLDPIFRFYLAFVGVVMAAVFVAEVGRAARSDEAWSVR